MNNSVPLHFRTLGEGEPLIILHGLFGSSDNWQTLGKKFAEKYKVYLVDQRNHGHSPHTEEFNYQLMAADLHRLVESEGLNQVNLIGHSMGGKTVMEFGRTYSGHIDKMIVADIGYKQYPMHHETILEGLHSLDLNVIKSRGEADRIMQKIIPEFGVRQFLLKNLYWVEKGKLGWRINIPVLEREMEHILAAIEVEQINVDTLFIRGEKSNYILDSDFASIEARFPNSEIYTLKGVGHWVHAEAPQEFYSKVIDFLR